MANNCTMADSCTWGFYVCFIASGTGTSGTGTIEQFERFAVIICTIGFIVTGTSGISTFSAIGTAASSQAVEVRSNNSLRPMDSSSRLYRSRRFTERRAGHLWRELRARCGAVAIRRGGGRSRMLLGKCLVYHKRCAASVFHGSKSWAGLNFA